jgi:uncharacterized iron-regulated protein
LNPTNVDEVKNGPSTTEQYQEHKKASKRNSRTSKSTKNAKISFSLAEISTCEDLECKKLNSALNWKIKKLESRLESTKVFQSMIIHDLKHPTDSLIDSLEYLVEQIKRVDSKLNHICVDKILLADLIDLNTQEKESRRSS